MPDMEKDNNPTLVKKALEFLVESISSMVKEFESTCTIRIPKLVLPKKKINNRSFSFLLI
jgi:hypothetical protein